MRLRAVVVSLMAAVATEAAPMDAAAQVGWRNVKAFGALGDGLTDDTDAIQRGLDAVAKEGGTLYFPRGVYVVVPTRKRHLRVGSNTTIEGEGLPTVIRVRDEVGDYGYLFGNPTPSTWIENVTIRRIRLDQNCARNGAGDIRPADFTRCQALVYFTLFKNVEIDDVVFSPTCGGTAVSLNGKGSTGARITRSRFRFVRGHSGEGNGKYDNSAIYVSARNHVVQGNTFEAEITEAARGAIETHEGPSIVSGNMSDGYETGVNIVSASFETPHISNINVSGNTFTGTGRGIQLWSATGRAIRNVIIANNTIGIANGARNAYNAAGIDFIRNDVNGKLDGAFENVSVTGNVLWFDPSSGAGRHDYNTTAAIGIAPTGNVRNVVVANNVVMNAPVQGVIFAPGPKGEGASVRIVNNVLTNVGSDGRAPRELRATVTLGGRLRDVEVRGNTISDDAPTCSGYQWLRVKEGRMERVRVDDNAISVRSGGLKMSMDGAQIDVGSRPEVRAVGSWPPEKLSVRAGDLIMRGSVGEDAEVSGVLVAETSGTWGHLTGVVASGRRGSSTVEVSETGALSVGDWIHIAGQPPLKIEYVAGHVVELSKVLSRDIEGMTVQFFEPRAAEMPLVPQSLPGGFTSPGR